MKFEQLQDGRIIVEFQTDQEKYNFIKLLMPTESMKAGEVMQVLNITRQTLCNYVKRGLIEIDTNYTGGQYRYNRESVNKLLNKKTSK